MRTTYFPASHDVSLTDLRTLSPGGHRTAKLGKTPEFEASPLFVLLGTLADDVDARVVDLATIGIDWTYATVGLSLLDDRTRVATANAIDVARKALEIRAHDIEVLDKATAYMSTEDIDRSSKRHDQLREQINLLMVGFGRLLWAPGDRMAFESDDIIAAAAFELVSRIHGKASPDEPIANRCPHCSCLFATRERSDEVYCRRLAPGEPVGGRTCQQVGPQYAYKDALSPCAAAYRAEYKRLDKRQRRGFFTREVLDEWRLNARLYLGLAETNHWSEARYTSELAKIAPKEEHS